MKTNVALLYIILILCSFTSVAKFSTLDESLKARALTQQIDMLGKEGEFSGSVLFSRQGQVLFHKVVGQIHPQSNQLITESSAFNLGLLSKQFTAMAIMILRYQGKLDYDKPIQMYLPHFPYSEVTTRHLLTHTSGIVNYEGVIDKSTSNQLLTNEDIMSMFIQFTPNLAFIPGSQYKVSNTDYVMLAHIVESVSEQSLEEFAKQHIFAPLNMHNTHIFTELSKNVEFKNRVYGQSGLKQNSQVHIDGVTGSGSVYSTAVDLLKWHEGLNTNKLLPPSLLNEAFSPAILNDGSIEYYGFGWVIDKRRPEIVSHSNDVLGSNAFIIRNMKTDELLILMSNYTKGIEFAKLKALVYSGFETQFSDIY
ncbi:beta-lactamase family protein [Pseudoalteromonas luteoviolacea]|uniref:serine hydrolase domain-containing protein n=1 Tax=Pseudoalteromonas luteoviolacea TaxID=43657 RepID=UPI001F1FDCB0|nr:serine hydrolase domain-containing protein [Pseudoalteromonas luteoviolacea]MCF6441827.1 beta-lactamase family protein [Pseudoalteromonas luteoviolacea]